MKFKLFLEEPLLDWPKGEFQERDGWKVFVNADGEALIVFKNGGQMVKPPKYTLFYEPVKDFSRLIAFPAEEWNEEKEKDDENCYFYIEEGTFWFENGHVRDFGPDIDVPKNWTSVAEGVYSFNGTIDDAERDLRKNFIKTI